MLELEDMTHLPGVCVHFCLRTPESHSPKIVQLRLRLQCLRMCVSKPHAITVLALEYIIYNCMTLWGEHEQVMS